MSCASGMVCTGTGCQGRPEFHIIRGVGGNRPARLACSREQEEQEEEEQQEEEDYEQE